MRASKGGPVNEFFNNVWPASRMSFQNLRVPTLFFNSVQDNLLLKKLAFSMCK